MNATMDLDFDRLVPLWQSLQSAATVVHIDSEHQYAKANDLLNALLHVVHDDERHPLYSLAVVVDDLMKVYEVNASFPRSCVGTHRGDRVRKFMSEVETDDDEEQFECRVYEVLSRFGFMEGDSLIPEEKPLVGKLCDYLVESLGIIDGRWQPEVCGMRYVAFKDLTTNETIGFYNMREIDRRAIDKHIRKRNLSILRIKDLHKNKGVRSL